MRTSFTKTIDFIENFIQANHLLTLLSIILFGVLFRFFQIHDDLILFYDEGMYLGRFAQIREIFTRLPNPSWSDYTGYLNAIWMNCLRDAKPIWFFFANLSFLFSVEHTQFLRVISAISSSVSLVAIYWLAKELKLKPSLQILSALLLSFLPSHIFYARLSLQEAFSGMCCLLAICAGLRAINKHFIWGVLTGMFFALAFLTNYRLIIFIALSYTFLIYYFFFIKQEKKTYLALITPLLIAVLVSLSVLLMNSGMNYKATFGWMGVQQDIASKHFYWSSLFFFPYSLMIFDSFVLLSLFLALPFLLRWKEKEHRTFLGLFGISLIYIIAFSLSAQKGVRYIHVIYPLIVICSVYAVSLLNKRRHFLASLLLFFLMIEFVYHVRSVLNVQQNYEDVAHFMNTQSPDSTVAFGAQWKVYRLNADQSLFRPIPMAANQFVQQTLQHKVRWLVLDPQIYIDKTKDPARFIIYDHLALIQKYLKPIKVYDHFNEYSYKRFIFEHTYNLGYSLKFLKEQNSNIKIYDNMEVMKLFQSLNTAGTP